MQLKQFRGDKNCFAARGLKDIKGTNINNVIFDSSKWFKWVFTESLRWNY